MEVAKERSGDTSSDDSDSEDEEGEAPATRKRPRPEPGPSKPSKRAKLVTNLQEPKTEASSSKAAQVWFSQDVFAGMGDALNAEDDESDAEMSVDGSDDADNSEAAWEDAVRPTSRSLPRF
jgi:AdoMet-dependent rRNA methyltransferase SPB1